MPSISIGIDIFRSPLLLVTEGTSFPGLFLSLVQALILGVVQGITEFLPISSTAHLLMWTRVFNWEMLGEKYFVDAIQFGSVIAVLIYFWADIRQIIGGSWEAYQKKDWNREEWKILIGIAIGTLPALLGGLLYKTFLPDSLQGFLEGALVIALMSIVMALLLGFAERFGARTRTFEQLTIKDGLLVGLGQMLALIPGASRSGSTITTALFLGLKRETAARFSFLLGLPTLALATLYQSLEVFEHLEALPALVVGTLSTFVFSYLSIAWLLKFLQRQSAWVFVWYRLGFGLSLISAIAVGVMAVA